MSDKQTIDRRGLLGWLVRGAGLLGLGALPALLRVRGDEERLGSQAVLGAVSRALSFRGASNPPWCVLDAPGGIAVSYLASRHSRLGLLCEP